MNEGSKQAQEETSGEHIVRFAATSLGHPADRCIHCLRISTSFRAVSIIVSIWWVGPVGRCLDSQSLLPLGDLFFIHRHKNVCGLLCFLSNGS